MFVVRAIQDKKLQNDISKELGSDFYENALAFYAADLKEDKSTIDSYISICQFYLNGDGEIICLQVADGREDDEAVIVMLRTVMNFMYRCGVKKAHFTENSTDDYWLKKSGFSNNKGVYEIDLVEFYSAHCCHN